jgi:polar amino acid transport system substrate-binding protein
MLSLRKYECRFKRCLVAAALIGLTSGVAHAETLKVAADVGYAPWAMRQPSGQVEGFVVDVANEFAKRIGRDSAEVVDVNFSAIFAGLFAGRYDMIVAPMSMTKERASQLLFTEGYMTSGLGLVVAEGSSIEKPEDLKGKILATNSGSFSDTWATQNAEKYGYTVQRYDKDTDAMQSVLAQRADANVVNLNVGQYAASKNKRLKVVYRVLGDYDLGYGFRKDNTELRNKVEAALECMKLEGVMQGLHEKWFGEAPVPADAMMKVFVGHGPIGLEGHDGAYHKLECK